MLSKSLPESGVPRTAESHGADVTGVPPRPGPAGPEPPRPGPAGPEPRRAASGEQAVAPVLALAYAGRAGEHAAAGVLDVLVQRVGAQGVLQLDELGRVLHERDEEQAAQQGAPLRIDAVGERVTAPQDAGAAVVLEA